VKNLAIGLWIIQVLAAFTMLIAAVFETESILATGPTLVVVGLLLGLATRPLQSWSALGFALSGPLVCALISFLIAAFGWGPREGHAPTLVILSTYLILSAPLAIAAWRRIWRWATNRNGLPLAGLQFSLKTLLITMTATCIVIAAAKLLADYIGRSERLIFGGFTLTVLVLCALVVWRCLAYPMVKSDAQS